MSNLQELSRNMITIAEICEAFKIKRRTLERWRKDLGFPDPIINCRSNLRFDQREITAWIEHQKEMAAKIREERCTQN